MMFAAKSRLARSVERQESAIAPGVVLFMGA
jgi:hypothetical protein